MMLNKRAILIALGIVLAIAATFGLKEYLRIGPTGCKPTAGSFSTTVPGGWQVSTSSGTVSGSISIPRNSISFPVTVTNVSGGPQTITATTLYISVDNKTTRVDEFPAGCTPFFGIKSNDCSGATLPDQGVCTISFGTGNAVSSGQLVIETSAGTIEIAIHVM